MKKVMFISILLISILFISSCELFVPGGRGPQFANIYIPMELDNPGGSCSDKHLDRLDCVEIAPAYGGGCTPGVPEGKVSIVCGDTPDDEVMPYCGSGFCTIPEFMCVYLEDETECRCLDDVPPEPDCPDGLINQDWEECDCGLNGCIPQELAYQTCEGLGHAGGVLDCTSGCQFDEGGCHDCFSDDCDGVCPPECEGLGLDPDCNCDSNNDCCPAGCFNPPDTDCTLGCVPNGCGGVPACPEGCTINDDPDCGCSMVSNDCCPDQCDNTNDVDCMICETNGACDGVCPIYCGVDDDPDCGCQNGNGCCGIGCDYSNDNDCGYCGDGSCEGSEDCWTCRDDCAQCGGYSKWRFNYYLPKWGCESDCMDFSSYWGSDVWTMKKFVNNGGDGYTGIYINPYPFGNSYTSNFERFWSVYEGDDWESPSSSTWNCGDAEYLWNAGSACVTGGTRVFGAYITWIYALEEYTKTFNMHQDDDSSLLVYNDCGLSSFHSSDCTLEINTHRNGVWSGNWNVHLSEGWNVVVLGLIEDEGNEYLRYSVLQNIFKNDPKIAYMSGLQAGVNPHAGSCEVGGQSYCGSYSPDGCWCDASCVSYGDCCNDACELCGYCDSALAGDGDKGSRSSEDPIIPEVLNENSFWSGLGLGGGEKVIAPGFNSGAE